MYFLNSTNKSAKLLLLLSIFVPSASADDASWEKVQDVLASTSDVIVFDGAVKAPFVNNDGDAPTYGDWLLRHVNSDPETINPHTRVGWVSGEILGFIFETLLYAEPNPPHEIKGRLASEYPEISDDGLRYSFALRPEARFADGQPVTSGDVLFSVKALMNPKVRSDAWRGQLSTLLDVEAEDDYRISFLFSEPDFFNDKTLGFHLKILPKHFYDPESLLDPVSVQSLVDDSWKQGDHADLVRRFAEQFNNSYNRKALGSGGYLIQDPEQDIVTQQKVVLTRNAGYWGKGIEGLPPAGYPDKMVFRVIVNQDAAFIEFTNGNLDHYDLQPLEFRDKSWSPNFSTQFLKAVHYRNRFQYIEWNNRHPIFSDRRVRKAMSLLTDRNSMIQHLLFGLGEVVVGPISPFRPEYNHDLAPHPYDPDQALDLLADAGWSDRDGDGVIEKVIDGETVRFEFEFLVRSGNQMYKDVALVMQNELKDIGIACTVRELDWSIYLERLRRGEHDATVLSIDWGLLAFPPELHVLYHSSQTLGNGLNTMGFEHGEVDSLTDAIRREIGASNRIALYHRLQEILHEEQPMTFLWRQRFVTAYSRRFRGVNWYPDGPHIGEWWVPEDARRYGSP